jgi:hypothetical protein
MDAEGGKAAASNRRTLTGTAMSRIDKHADYYRGYVADERSLASVVGVLVTTITIWLLFYLLSLVGPAPPSAERPLIHGAYGVTQQAPIWAQQERVVPSEGR